MGKPKSKVFEVRVAGPLAPFAEAFKAELEAAGYTPLTTVNEMRVAASLSRWLEEEALSASDLSRERIEKYINARRAAGYVSHPSRRALGSLLGVLEAAGVVRPALPAGPTTGAEALLASFRTYLFDERGLSSSTTGAYVSRARRFMVGLPDGLRLSDLSSKEVTDAVLRESATWSVGATQYFVAGLRSFLRFCFAEGLTPSDLSAATLSATGRRASTLPLGISGRDADALLASCDRRRAEGRRDYAILLTLLRLGLRASEVAAVTLDDIDWRAGLVVVHGKGRRDDSLPLPDDVGRAVAGYLQRGRPATACREVFLRTLAPAGPLGRGGVSFVVRRACKRTGIAPVGAHRLRHTLACGMVAAGVPLPEISQVLRHRSISSTANYARVDIDALRALAQPWPGSAA
jgi:site-specific recombinase XerD